MSTSGISNLLAFHMKAYVRKNVTEHFMKMFACSQGLHSIHIAFFCIQFSFIQFMYGNLKESGCANATC